MFSIIFFPSIFPLFLVFCLFFVSVSFTLFSCIQTYPSLFLVSLANSHNSMYFLFFFFRSRFFSCTFFYYLVALFDVGAFSHLFPASSYYASPRGVDLVTALATPLTYEGLIDDLIGIENGWVLFLFLSVFLFLFWCRFRCRFGRDTDTDLVAIPIISRFRFNYDSNFPILFWFRSRFRSESRFAILFRPWSWFDLRPTMILFRFWFWFGSDLAPCWFLFGTESDLAALATPLICEEPIDDLIGIENEKAPFFRPPIFCDYADGDSDGDSDSDLFAMPIKFRFRFGYDSDIWFRSRCSSDSRFGFHSDCVPDLIPISFWFYSNVCSDLVPIRCRLRFDDLGFTRGIRGFDERPHGYPKWMKSLILVSDYDSDWDSDLMPYGYIYWLSPMWSGYAIDRAVYGIDGAHLLYI